MLSDQAISVKGFTGGQPNLMGSVGPENNSKFSALRAAIGAGWSVFPAASCLALRTATTPLVEVKI